MNEIATKIGSAVVGFFTNMDSGALWQALKIVGVGMLGIFVVTLAIIGVVSLLNKLGGK